MKAIGYARVSIEDKGQGVSLKSQKSKIKYYCKLKDLELTRIVTDNGKSGKNLNRPGVQRVLKAVQKKEVQNVVVFRLDRMFRSTLDLLQTMKLFDKKEVNFHSITESLDTETPHGKFSLTILGAVAEMERDLISTRMKAVAQYKKDNNLKGSGWIPFGYDVVGKKLIINESEQKVIQMVCNLHKSGLNYTQVAGKLNDMGYKTKYGKMFRAQQIKNIVRG